MEISTKLQKILLGCVTSPIATALLEIEKQDEFINSIGYLDLAIEDKTKISYITEDRKERFKVSKFTSFNVGDWVKVNEDNNTFYYVNNGIEAKKSRLHKHNIYVTYCDDNLVEGHIFTSHKIVKNRILCNNGLTDAFNRSMLYKPNSDNITFDYDFNHAEFRAKYAYMAKFGKLVKKIFINKFSDKEIENFAALFIAQTNPLIQRGLYFEEVSGDDIAKYYREENHYKCGDGSLGSSCMRYDNCQKFFGIYTNNPGIKLLVLKKKENEKIVGRALIWENVTILKKTRTLMDRIYSINSNDEAIFKQYAISKGYVYKKYQSQKSTAFIIDGTLVDNLRVDVYLPKMNFSYYPYVDTFHYYHGNFLSTHQEIDYIEGIALCRYNTGKAIEEATFNYSQYSRTLNELIPNRYAIYCNIICDYFHLKDCMYIENERYWVHKSVVNEKYIRKGNRWFKKSYCIEYKGNYYFEYDVVNDKKGSQILKKEAVYIEDSWMHEDEAINYIDSKKSNK